MSDAAFHAFKARHQQQYYKECQESTYGISSSKAAKPLWQRAANSLL